MKRVNFGRRCGGRRAFLGVLFGLSFSQALRAEIPGPSDPTATTDRAFRQRMLVFNRAMLGNAYLASGRRDEEWDGAAVAFLDQSANHFVNFDSAVVNKIPGEPLERLIERGKSLVEKDHCDDGTVVYCYGRFLQEAGKTDDAYEQLHRAALTLAGSAYPAFRVIRSIEVYCRLAAQRNDLKDVRALSLRGRELLPKLFADATTQGEGRRWLMTNLAPEFAYMGWQESLRTLDALEADPKLKPDPWLVAMLRGNAEVQAAWEARGSDVAVNVKPDGWQGFSEHLELAHKHLSKAYELEPTYPEAATAMISVAMGDGGRLNITPREWFDKAVAAHVDYSPAYRNLRWALRPRWGGGYAEMYALGVECLAGQRYDTALPGEYFATLLDIVNDQGDTGFVASPAVYQQLQGVLKHLADAPGGLPGEAQKWYTSMAFALAARVRNYGDAKQFLDELKGAPDTQTYNYFLLRSEEAAPRVAAWTGPQAALVEEANGLVRQGEIKDAIARLSAAVSALPADDAGVPWLRRKVTELSWRQAVAAPDAPWVDVTPKPGFEGWLFERGVWSIDPDGRVVGQSFDSSGARLLLTTPLGDRFAVRFQPRMIPVTAGLGAMENIAYPGVLVPCAGLHDFSGVFVNTTKPEGKLLAIGTSPKDLLKDVPVTPDSVVEIEYFDGATTVRVDGKPVIENEEIREPDSSAWGEPSAPPRLALSASFARENSRVGFTKVEVRQLKTKPQ